MCATHSDAKLLERSVDLPTPPTAEKPANATWKPAAQQFGTPTTPRPLGSVVTHPVTDEDDFDCTYDEWVEHLRVDVHRAGEEDARTIKLVEMPI